MPSSHRIALGVMSNDTAFDFASFQQLLENAFAVQESGMDARLLSSVVALQRLIGSGQLDLDGTMNLICERARGVASASGIAISLLKGDQLVYKAGCGSAAAYVGRHVMATLSTSARHRTRCEILRVEDAGTDARIEASICRQFGAQSLLILPIYREHTIAGTLQVFFSEAHAYQDQEVRTYRLMAGFVEDALSQAVQPGANKAPEAEPFPVRERIEQLRPNIPKLLNQCGSVAAVADKHPVCHTDAVRPAEPRPLAAPRHSALAAARVALRITCLPLHWHRWASVLAATAVLVIASWIIHRGPASALGSSPQKSNGAGQQVPVTSTSQGSPKVYKPAASVLTAGVSKGAGPILRSIPFGNREIDDVAPDVTLRHFIPASMLKVAPAAQSHIEYFGDDVTVRYFGRKVIPQRTRVKDVRVVDLSDDVTVRYFSPNQDGQTARVAPK